MDSYNKGQILSIASHIGVVVEVYRSDDENTPPVLKIDFVKNAIRQTGTELVDMSVVPDRAVESVAIGDLYHEWIELMGRQSEYFDDLIKKVGA